MAIRRLPRTNAPVYLRGYVQILRIARAMPVKFKAITSKKNLLGTKRQWGPELISTATDRYVLNHNWDRIHRLALFCIRFFGGGYMGTSLKVAVATGRGFFSLTVVCGAGKDKVCFALCDGARRPTRSMISTGFSGVTIGTGRGFFNLTVIWGAGIENNGCGVLYDGVGYVVSWSTNPLSASSTDDGKSILKAKAEELRFDRPSPPTISSPCD